MPLKSIKKYFHTNPDYDDQPAKKVHGAEFAPNALICCLHCQLKVDGRPY